MFGKRKFKKADDMIIDDTEEDDPDEKIREVEAEKEILKQRIEQLQKKTSTPKQRTMVVKELPVQPVRSYTEEDGTIVNLITIEEALSKLLE